MNEDALNLSLRKFLKKVGVTSQREIEQAIRKAVADKTIGTDAALPAKVRLTIAEIDLDVEIDGNIELS